MPDEPTNIELAPLEIRLLNDNLGDGRVSREASSPNRQRKNLSVSKDGSETLAELLRHQVGLSAAVPSHSEARRGLLVCGGESAAKTLKSNTIRVLLIEDNPGDAQLVREALATSKPAFDVQHAGRLSNGLACLADGGIDVVLLDLSLPDSHGLASFLRVRTAAPSVPVVMLSGGTDEELALEAVRAGAQDYLVKGRCNGDLLTRSLRYAIERKRTQETLGELAQRLTYHVDNSPLAVVEWGSDMRLIRWSSEAERLFGWKSEEVLGKRIGDFRWIHEEDAPEVEEIVTSLQSGTGRFSANRNYRKDGSIVHCEWYNSSLVDASGKMRSVLSLVLDVTERKQAAEKLSAANRQLRQLSTDLLRSQDYERRRIARELHDSTAQLLAALSMKLSHLRDPALEASRKRELLSECIDLAGASCREIRTVTYLLHPPLLDETGLVSALQTYADGFRERTGIQIELRIPSDLGRLDGALELALFRIVQEGLANVHRHSGSALALITVEKDTAEVCLVLQDRGRGFPAASNGRSTGFFRFGVGILGMRERAEHLGGTLEITSSDSGTTLTARLPLVNSK